jgi:hypothetical protein
VRFVRRYVVAAAVLPLLATGCSDDPQPKFEPSPSDSPSESNSDPAEPKAWEVKSEKGAVAFATHWIDVFNGAAASGDTEPLTELSSPACQTCMNFVALIDGIYADGGQYKSAGWAVIGTSSADGLPANQGSVAMRIRQPAERITRPGQPAERHESATVTYSARLGWEDGQWQMQRLLFLS